MVTTITLVFYVSVDLAFVAPIFFQSSSPNKSPRTWSCGDLLPHFSYPEPVVSSSRGLERVKEFGRIFGREKVNLVPRVFSLSNMAAAGEKTLAHSRNHVTDLSTESGNLFKMAAKIKTERIWVRGLGTEEKQTKWRQRQTQEKLKI